MIFYDISVPIKPNMPIWPGDPQVELTSLASISSGDQSNLTKICMSMHTGTHIDAPKHFINHGKTVDQIPLEKLCGKAVVIQFDDEFDVICESDLINHPNRPFLESASKILFRTRNSSLWDSSPGKFKQNYVGIDPSAANYLCHLELDLIGIDYLSVAPFMDTQTSHEILLSAGIVLLEGLNLSDIKSGIYELFCLPLKVIGVEGSPVRAILVEY